MLKRCSLDRVKKHLAAACFWCVIYKIEFKRVLCKFYRMFVGKWFWNFCAEFPELGDEMSSKVSTGGRFLWAVFADCRPSLTILGWWWTLWMCLAVKRRSVWSGGQLIKSGGNCLSLKLSSISPENWSGLFHNHWWHTHTLRSKKVLLFQIEQQAVSVSVFTFSAQRQEISVHCNE